MAEPEQVTEQERRALRGTITRFLTVGLVALVGIVASGGVLMSMNQRQIELIGHSYQVEREIANIRLAVARLVAVSREPHGRKGPSALLARAPVEAGLSLATERLSDLSRDNPRQQARIVMLTDAARKAERNASAGAVLDDTGGYLSPDPTVLVNRLCDVMAAEESRLLDLRIARLRDIDNGLYVILGLAGVLLAVVGALIFTTLRSYTRELSASHEALHEANEGLEAAVQERTAELKRANAEIQRFAYIVSHDLHSPLVNILGFTSELEAANAVLHAALDKARTERPDSIDPTTCVVIEEDMPEAIHFIRSSSAKMDRLINAILELSRLGHRTLRPQWIELGTLCHAVADTMQVRLAESGGELVLDEPMPEILSDRLSIEQIIANLVENAIKYAHRDRPPHVRVTARRSGPDVVIEVADNGRGISEKDHDRVFDLFRRSGPQDREGEGIGLAHVRGLAHRLGGTVALRSKPGVGSTFTVTLPVHYQAADPS
ncbi:sensor histidine kinase [Novosphingobium nitrogenifigens]|nr:HAMP domain-containing sensor histidine kinase [Novosphingobium nitrogenifigens]